MYLLYSCTKCSLCQWKIDEARWHKVHIRTHTPTHTHTLTQNLHKLKTFMENCLPLLTFERRQGIKLHVKGESKEAKREKRRREEEEQEKEKGRC